MKEKKEQEIEVRKLLKKFRGWTLTDKTIESILKLWED